MKHLLLLILLLGCGTIPQDKTPSPIESQLSLLEMHVPDRTEQGLIGMVYTEDNLDQKFSFTVIGSGTYQIVSTRCNYNERKVFSSKNLSKIEITLSDLLERKDPEEFGCLFNIFVITEELDRGLTGQLFLVKKEEFEYVDATILGQKFTGTGWLQARESKALNWDISFDVKGRAGIFFFEGCGKSEQRMFEGNFSVPAKFFLESSPKTCVYEMGFLFNEGGSATFSLNFKTFKDDYIQLAMPFVHQMGKKIKVIAEDIVGFTAINGNVDRGNTNSHRIKDKEAPYEVRLLTSNGRYLLLRYKNEEIIWKPFFLY